jgi:hypothetical protein
MAQKPHEPTDESRRLARTLSGVGVTQDNIAVMLGITKPTLHAHYRRELDLGMAEANAKVAGSLFKMVEEGNVAAAIFWLKVRCGWSEKIQTEHSGELVVRWSDEGARIDVKNKGDGDD